jgi:hypothetical protein
MLGYVVGSKNIMAMGDDSVEDGSQDAVVKYEEMGHIIKTFEKCKNGFEFCSTRIYERDGRVVGEPVNWSRTFYRLVFATKDYDDRLRQFKYEMRHAPQLIPCLNALQRAGWGPSKHVEENGKTEENKAEEAGKGQE